MQLSKETGGDDVRTLDRGDLNETFRCHHDPSRQWRDKITQEEVDLLLREARVEIDSMLVIHHGGDAP